MPVVIDTSVALKWVLSEMYGVQAETLRDDLLRRREDLIAPSLLLYEATNVLYQYAHRGVFSLSSAQRRISDIRRPLNLQPVSASIARRAMAIADIASERYAYDVQFLALAEQLGCDLWTADEDFQKAMNRNGFDQVKGIRVYPLSMR